MKHILPVTSLVAILFVGCATSAHRASYEYRFVHGESRVENIQKEINDLAREGWRVSSFALGDNGHYKYVLLERRIRE
jgi:hypothetical protein